MSFARSFLLLIFVSLVSALGLLVLGSKMGYSEYLGGYAVLSADISVDDRVLRELLDAEKDNFSGQLLSESSQWVILDEFGSLEIIPLDKYRNRLHTFDPRNDGYAEKLRDVFIRDDRRFIYIPLKTGIASQALVDNQIKKLLGDIPFTVDYFGIGKPVSLFFILFASSSLALLLICYVNRKNHQGEANVIALLPPLSSLAFFGVPGIAACALFLGFAVALRKPLYELVMLLRFKGNDKIKLIYKNAIFPYKLYWLLLPLFAAALGVIVYFSELKLLFVTAVFAAVCAVFFLSIVTFSLLGGKHRRFTPVLIMRRSVTDFSFSLYMLPFIASAFLAMLLSPHISGAYVNNSRFDALLDERDYFDHLTYQTSFSMMQLGNPDAGYPVYKLDEDGLPSLDMSSYAISDKYPSDIHPADVNPSNIHSAGISFDEFPPFPLRHLMDFFAGVNSGSKVTGGNGGETGQNLSLLVLLLFIIPVFFFKRRVDLPLKSHFAAMKRDDGKLRRTDINRKNVILYKSKKSLRIQGETAAARTWWKFRKDA